MQHDDSNVDIKNIWQLFNVPNIVYIVLNICICIYSLHC